LSLEATELEYVVLPGRASLFQVSPSLTFPRWLRVTHRDDGSRELLPLRPIAVGFAANTLLYGCAAYMLLLVPTLRTHLRRRRNLCPSCGYSREGLGEGACPECGVSSPRGSLS
jgi:hypothetical protein